MSGLQRRVPQEGETLGGKYLLKRILGEGGMGTVFEAEHLRLRQACAIKFLNPGMLGVEEIVKRFEREARAAATLKSRHVVRVMDVEATPDGIPYMVMELLGGQDLEGLRAARPKLPYEEVVDYILQACEALAEAHDAGIVHRDLKPGNLFLARQDDDTTLVKVLDFGISKFLAEETKLTSAGAVMGTAIYMSPEQIRGESVDVRADIWALGVILYELLTGDAPWSGPATRIAAGIVSEPPPDIRARAPIPEPLARTIEMMLEKPLDRRPGSIAEVAYMLAPFAPPGTAGREAAERVARRLSRGGGSSARMIASMPPEMASARTMIQDPKSTDIAATMANVAPRRSNVAVYAALGVFLVLGATGVALVLKASTKSKQVAIAASVAPPVVAAPVDSAPIVVEAPAPAVSSVAITPSSAPSASAPKPGAAVAVRPATPPKPSVATTEPTKAPEPPAPAKPKPKPPEPVNPTFLQ